MGRISSARTFAASLIVALTAALALAGPATAFPTDGGTPVACSANTGYVQTFSPDFALPEGLGPYLMTQWKVQAGPGGGTMAVQTLKSSLNDANDYTALAESAVETLTPSSLNVFDTRIPVTIDRLDPSNFGFEVFLGLRVASGSPDCLYSGFPNDQVRQASPAAVAGAGPTTHGSVQNGYRLNLEVVLEPDEDEDGFGDLTQDGCTKTAQRQDDCVKPTVTMDKGKPKKRKATFVFHSDEPGTFECHLEDKKFSPCTSPVKLKRLKPGLHNFTVRAVDLNNNKSGQTSFRWRVAEPRHR